MSLYAGGKLFHRHISGKRLSAGCIFLSLAAIGAVYTLIFSADRLQLLWSNSPLRLYYIFFILIGIFSGIWYRLFFPVALICYIAYAMIVSVYLYSALKTPDSAFSISIQEKAVVIGETSYQTTGADRIIDIAVITIPQELLLPVPAVWVCSVTASDKNVPQQKVSDIFHFTALPGILRFPLQKYSEILCRDYSNIYISVPKHDFLPVLYTLKCSYNQAEFSYEMNRNL